MLVGLALTCLAPASAQVVTYESVVFPESDAWPWMRIQQGPDAQRWFDNGLFCQSIGPGQFDGYKRSIAEFTGAPSFFVTWREITDAPRSQLEGVPNALVTTGGPVLFHFTVTTDQVRLVRDNPVGLVLYVDIAPGALHTYYLEIHNDLTYIWYIDGSVVNSGPYPGVFPRSSAVIQWASAYYVQTPKWDYVRYGVIPAEHSGDFNNNGAVDTEDLYFFVDCLLGPDYDAAGPGCKWADMNADGVANAADIQQFVSAMTVG